jgi:hypothetical protein
MADGGGGGGGGGVFDSFQNFIDQVARPVVETQLTGGANQTEEGKKWKKSGDDFVKGITGEAAREAADAEKQSARRAQQERAQQIADQEAKSAGRDKFAGLRNKQKGAGGKGRASTILTSPLGTPVDGAASSGKTLLGS